jgi:hypothetical protein
MALPIYPQDELDNPFELLGLIGNFWSDLFGQTEQVKSLLSARASQDKQVNTNFYELLDSISRLKIKPLRKKAWYLLTFDTAQRNKTYLNTPRYNQTTANYGGEIFYDGVQSLSYTTYWTTVNSHFGSSVATGTNVICTTSLATSFPKSRHRLRITNNLSTQIMTPW